MCQALAHCTKCWPGKLSDRRRCTPCRDLDRGRTCGGAINSAMAGHRKEPNPTRPMLAVPGPIGIQCLLREKQGPSIHSPSVDLRRWCRLFGADDLRRLVLTFRGRRTRLCRGCRPLPDNRGSAEHLCCHDFMKPRARTTLLSRPTCSGMSANDGTEHRTSGVLPDRHARFSPNLAEKALQTIRQLRPPG